MTVRTTKEAWEKADEIFPTDYEKNNERSDRAGYDIYESTLEGCNSWISDLGNRLEVNLENGETVNIWIDCESVENGEEEVAEVRETVVTLESETTKRTLDETTTTKRTAEISFSADMRLKDLATFEGDARRLIKAARASANRGEAVSVTLCRAKYGRSKAGELVQVLFEMWTGEGDAITADGVHLSPIEKYNDDLWRDMWITGDRGEVLHEITI